MVTTGERGSALDKLPSSSSAPGYRFSPLIASRNSLKSSHFDISQKSPFLCSTIAPQIQLIVSNVLTLNDDILLPQVVSTPRSEVWRRKVDLTPSQPPSHLPPPNLLSSEILRVTSPSNRSGGRDTKLEISPRRTMFKTMSR